MLLLLLLIVVAIICMVLASRFDEYDYDGVYLFYLIMGVMCTFAITAILIISIVVNVGEDGYLTKKQQEYESLVYQLENNLYDNDNDLGKKQLYDQIQEYNSNIAFGKKMQDNLWIGIMVEDIYDELELIKYNN